jgi:hypothetical protein
MELVSHISMQYVKYVKSCENSMIIENTDSAEEKQTT